MDIKQFVEDNQLQDKDVVSVVKDQFSGYDKTIHSKVKKPDKYGITLIDTAEKLIRAQFEDGMLQATEAKKKDRHRLPCSMRCRMSKRLKRRLQQRYKADGFKTDQQFLDSLINRYLGDGK